MEILKVRSVIKPLEKKISNTRKKLFSTGNLNVTGGKTKWIKYGNLKVQGTYEYRACHILDEMLRLGEIYSWEYTNDRFPYLNEDSKKSSYLLDFKVYTTKNSFYYLETKGYIKENDINKWKSVKDLGFDLHVWFEEELKFQENRLNIKNAV